MKCHQLVAASLVTALTAASAHAVTVWQEDFTGEAAGVPLFQDFTSNGVNDWAASSATVTTSIGMPSPSLNVFNTTAIVTSAVPLTQMAAFTTANSAQQVLSVAFDWRIDAYTAGSTTLTPRFQLLNNSASFVNLGFGTDNLSGGELYLWASNATSAAPGASTRIGSGDAWTFDTYDAATAANNNTDGEFVHVEIRYADQSTTATIMLSYGANTAELTVMSLTPTTFSNSTGTGQFIQWRALGTNTAQYVDNILVQAQAVPEPMSVGLLVVGAGLIARRRRTV